MTDGGPDGLGGRAGGKLLARGSSSKKGPDEAMMQYCREQDGTPGVVTALLLARAIDAVNPGNTRPIVTGMAMNLRPALEAPDYMGAPIGIAYLSYDGKLKEKPFTTQATGYRGRLILASDPDRLRLATKEFCGLCKLIDSLPQLMMKRPPCKRF